MKQCWCGNSNLSEYSETYFVCDKCHTLVSKMEIAYDEEHINDDVDLYGKNYWEQQMLHTAHLKEKDDLIVLYLKERAMYWLKRFLPYMLPGTGTVLEVGCGLGQFSYLLKLCGYQEYALELSPHNCHYISEKLGIRIHCGGLKPLDQPVPAIVAFDVLEHIIEPDAFLAQVSQTLTDDGILMIQTPCYDPALNYEQMLESKSNFKNLLCEDEHVYLYSRESVCQLLKKHGFIHVEFMDAFFGNDYDMFFVASRKPIHHYSQAEIDRALERQSAGWLIKAMMELWQENRSHVAELQSLHGQAEDHLRQIVQLTDSLTEKNQAYALLQEDHAHRQKLIESLSRQLEVSETDRAERLATIERLGKQLEESETDRAERLTVIERLSKQLEESETDRANRLEQILTLTKMIQEMPQS